ncbi:MAG: hypothetical protein E7Z90_00395 [Cyanobacteria bacterium SIG29]|nr:hypothetical protein [Cyanobacteria bacterium SIG29]
MKVSPILTVVSKVNNIHSRILATRINGAVEGKDSFEISPETRVLLESQKILSKSRKFNVSDYESLSHTEKAILRNTSLSIKESAEKTLQVGLKVKEHLDNRFGEGNYVFVSIGTSPSGVGRVLEFCGVETKYLPISGLRHFSEDDEYKEFEADFPLYVDFLAEQGLTKEEMNSSGKEYLFFDYTLTGKSLETFKKMMKEDFDLDNPHMHFKSFDFECYSSTAKKIDPPQYALDYVNEYLFKEKMAKYGGIRHLPIWDLICIEECKYYQCDDAKRFNFLIMDKLNKMNLLKYNPANKKSL